MARQCLEGRHGAWALVEDGCTTARWPSLGEAIEVLWRERKIRDQAPWAVGWLGYQACAELGGDLPARPDTEGAPSGILLLEPTTTDSQTVLGAGSTAKGAVLRTSLSEEQFMKGVQSIRGHIADGTVYQVNLCRRFTVNRWDGGLRSLFDVASAGSAVPDYLSAFSWEGVSPGELVCASMELLVSRRHDRMETKPIKGTRPRGATAGEDRRLIRQLETDPKERAELAMIVDLERNDLGRIARTGSVVVEDPGRVRSWERIHHRVARVTASVWAGMPWQDIVAVMAPGGSVTGCPKRSAMSMIAGLEPVGRGPFTGALGVIAGNGDLELALPIRTAWTSDGRLEMAAGCGIVWESDPLAEEVESRLKIGNWLELVESS
ncbi:MAG: anthranilate synthase component I family protein [Acidobacteria bacterium]|nr:anthranilate synthase component I family protein [Acidobacteriota bacterium]